jgi:hypothetical protein
LGALLFTRECLADLVVTFEAPHVARAPAAALDAEYARAIDARIREAKVASLEELIQLSLDVSGAGLRFGLGHKTTLTFGTREREGNCIEYAHLFASVFNRGAERRHISARAYVIHSDARVLGQKLPMHGLDDHDWVLVVPTDPKAKRLFIDPTLHDIGLDWNIARSVSGDVRAL